MPNQQFIVFVAESTGSHRPFASNVESHHQEIQNGYWGNLWAMTPDGGKWYQLTNSSTATDGPIFGVLAPIASNNKVMWAKLVGLPDRSNPEGYWRLYIADLAMTNGTPSLENATDITPSSTTTTVEPQDVSPDGSTFLLSANVNTPPYGWDTNAYTVSSGKFINLNPNSPNDWDEHARFSPDGRRIVWATSLPFAALPTTMVYPQLINTTLRTEYYLMNADGSGQTQLTHFNQPGYSEYTGQKTIANVPIWSYDGTQILAGTEPTGLYLATFRGPCGKQ